MSWQTLRNVVIGVAFGVIAGIGGFTFIYAQQREEVAGVITDMMMPFMDGPATIRALQKMNPQVRIIAASGLGGLVLAAEAASAGVQ